MYIVELIRSNWCFNFYVVLLPLYVYSFSITSLCQILALYMFGLSMLIIIIGALAYFEEMFTSKLQLHKTLILSVHFSDWLLIVSWMTT